MGHSFELRLGTHLLYEQKHGLSYRSYSPLVYHRRNFRLVHFGIHARSRFAKIDAHNFNRFICSGGLVDILLRLWHCFQGDLSSCAFCSVSSCVICFPGSQSDYAPKLDWQVLRSSSSAAIFDFWYISIQLKYFVNALNYIVIDTKSRIAKKINECHQTVETFVKREAQNDVQRPQLGPAGLFLQSAIKFDSAHYVSLFGGTLTINPGLKTRKRMLATTMRYVVESNRVYFFGYIFRAPPWMGSKKRPIC